MSILDQIKEIMAARREVLAAIKRRDEAAQELFREAELLAEKRQQLRELRSRYGKDE